MTSNPGHWLRAAARRARHWMATRGRPPPMRLGAPPTDRTDPPAPGPAAPCLDGLPPAPVLSRNQKLLAGLDLAHMVGAEIGPLHSPVLRKDKAHVLYIDHCDTETLRQKYAGDPVVDVSTLHVDAVWGQQTLREAVDSYAHAQGDAAALEGLDYVIASHVIEHVPDMIGWLREIDSVLKPGGQVRLAVPDRRFTFDVLRRTTTLPDLLYAHLCRARVPSAPCILDFALNVVTVDCPAIWRGQAVGPDAPRQFSFESALAMADDARRNGSYHDVHCWVFTPASFIALCGELARHGLLDFACQAFHDTELDHNEFIVSLRRCTDRDEAVASWRAVAPLARQYSFVR